MFGPEANAPVAGSKISVVLSAPAPLRPPAIKTRPSLSRVAVCPRRSTDMVVLGAGGSNSAISAARNAGLTALAFTSGALLKIAAARVNNGLKTFADDSVEPSAIAEIETSAINTNNRKAPRLVRIVLVVESKSERKEVLGAVLITRLQNEVWADRTTRVVTKRQIQLTRSRRQKREIIQAVASGS